MRFYIGKLTAIICLRGCIFVCINTAEICHCCMQYLLRTKCTYTVLLFYISERVPYTVSAIHGICRYGQITYTKICFQIILEIYGNFVSKTLLRSYLGLYCTYKVISWIFSTAFFPLAAVLFKGTEARDFWVLVFSSNSSSWSP